MSRIILLFFLLWSAIDSWILFLATKTIPYLGFFPYKQEIFEYGMSQISSSLANFDGIHYLKIAERGYSQWEQAFFPLYPLLVRMTTPLTGNALLSGIIVSNLAFVVGLLVMSLTDYSLDGKSDSGRTKIWTMIFILAFPTSFFFGSVYTEGVFFLFFWLVLFALKSGKYWPAALFALLASLTRLVGVFLLVPIMFHLLKNHMGSRRPLAKFISDRRILLLAAPLLGLGIYCYYLYRTTGDPFFFLTSQPVFGANRSTSVILLPQVLWRYAKIFATARHNFQYFVSVFEFTVFIVVFSVLTMDFFKIVKIKLKNGKRGNPKNLKFNLLDLSGISSASRRIEFRILNMDRLGLNLFSFANLILPTLTGTLSSIPRYALFSISFFLFLAELEAKWIKIVIALVFLAIHILALGYFSQGYFIS